MDLNFREAQAQYTELRFSYRCSSTEQFISDMTVRLKLIILSSTQVTTTATIIATMATISSSMSARTIATQLRDVDDPDCYGDNHNHRSTPRNP